MSEEQPGLPAGFLFSQHSLNTYSRCKRRFWLRYVARLPWPVPEGDAPLEYEAHLERGRVLHQWIQRHLVGLPVAADVADQELEAWWQRYLAFDWRILPDGIREPELPVIVAVGEHRLYARYDLAALAPGGQCVVVDWKTLGSIPTRTVMERRVQTRVYLYTLARAAASLLGGEEVAPERISMLYWFAMHPDEPIWVSYDARAFDADGLRLEAMMTEITRQPRVAFTRTEQVIQCVRCNYRTLCERDEVPGGQAAGADWLDEELAAAVDLNDVPEVPY